MMPSRQAIEMQLVWNHQSIRRARREYSELLFPDGVRRELSEAEEARLDAVAEAHARYKKSASILAGMLEETKSAAQDAATRRNHGNIED